MDRNGANPFPFYNLSPVLRNISKNEFFCAFFLSLLDKIKVDGDSCLPRHFANTNAKRKPAFLKKSPGSGHRITQWFKGENAINSIHKILRHTRISHTFHTYILHIQSMHTLYILHTYKHSICMHTPVSHRKRTT